MGLADYIKSRLPYWPNWINALLLKCNIFGSAVYGPAYRKMLRSIDSINPEQKLVEMVNYAIEHVPYYRNRYGTLRIKSRKDFEQHIGFIDKQEVLNHWNEFLSDDIDESNVIYGTTGGSTGKPMKLVFPLNRYLFSMTFIHRIWLRFGWNYETRGVFRNHHIEPGRDYIINPVMREIIFDTFRMNDSYAAKCWKILKKHNVRFIHAYPSSFYQFCKLCCRQNLDLSFIKTVFLGSEGITNEQRVLFQNLNIQICTWYGHSECLILAGNSPASSLLEIESGYGHCELIDDEEKVISAENLNGQLVGTAYFNTVFPLIRYKTGDYSMYAASPNQNNEEMYLSSVHGHRDNSVIKKIDGTYTTTTALNLHGEIYSHIDGLQYMQKTKGYLIVCIIRNENYSDTDEATFRKHFSDAMGGEEYVEIRYVKSLIYGANHKFAQLISSI